MLDSNRMVMGGCLLRIWWGGVECYLREIKQDPLRHFCSTSPESFWQPASVCLHWTQRRGQKTTWGLTLSRPWCTLWDRRTYWLTDWLATLHFKALTLICALVCLEKICVFFFFFLAAWAPLWLSSYDLCDNAANREGHWESVLQTFFIFFHLLSV